MTCRQAGQRTDCKGLLPPLPLPPAYMVVEC